MAYIEQLKISAGTHLKNSVEYVTNEMKTNYDLISGINCIPETVEEEFKLIKELYNKTDGILAHHIVQSFKPGEVDAETAHEIGIKFAEKIAPGYQILIATHTDKAHVHNHILINSVNMETGYKFNACKDSLKFMREESDKLCVEYGLSIIEPQKGKSIDKGTYRAAERGASYKVSLMRTIDEGIETALSVSENFRREEFISYMQTMGYEVKWENKNISFKDQEHTNFIKGKRLSEEYAKEAIENRLGIFEGRDKGKELDTIREASGDLNERTTRHKENTEIDTGESGSNTKRAKRKRKYETEWEKYRRNSEIQKASMVGKIIDDKKYREDNILYQELKLALILIKDYKKRKKAMISNKNNSFKVREIKGSARVNNYNNEYNSFKELPGENYIIRNLNIDQVAKVKSSGIKCAVFNNVDKFNMAIKDVDKLSVAKIIDKDVECGNVTYRQLKKLVKGEKGYIKISKEEYEKLINSNIKFAAFDRGSFINVIAEKDQMKDVIKIIERNYEEQLGNIKYSSLLKEDGKTVYKIVSKNDLEKLNKSGIRYAAFDKGESINIAFKEKDLQRINELINQKVRINSKER